MIDLKKILKELGTQNIVRYYTESEVEQAGIQKAKALEQAGIAKYSE
ncbi:MAG: hypothetical protein GXP45_03495 [bacterium]|nr:hypothetical protein [bacterium]